MLAIAATLVTMGCGLFSSFDGLSGGAANDAADTDAGGDASKACTLTTSPWRTGLDATNLGAGGAWNEPANGLLPSDGSIVDREVRLVMDGTPGGASRSVAGSTGWGTTKQTVTYGGSDDTWGTTLTPQVVNGDSFGVAIKARYTDTAGNSRAYIDGVEIQVTYCP